VGCRPIPGFLAASGLACGLICRERPGQIATLVAEIGPKLSVARFVVRPAHRYRPEAECRDRKAQVCAERPASSTGGSGPSASCGRQTRSSNTRCRPQQPSTRLGRGSGPRSAARAAGGTTAATQAPAEARCRASNEARCAAPCASPWSPFEHRHDLGVLGQARGVDNRRHWGGYPLSATSRRKRGAC
jgi:hypothetical protein